MWETISITDEEERNLFRLLEKLVGDESTTKPPTPPPSNVSIPLAFNLPMAPMNVEKVLEEKSEEEFVGQSFEDWLEKNNQNYVFSKVDEWLDQNITSYLEEDEQKPATKEMNMVI